MPPVLGGIEKTNGAAQAFACAAPFVSLYFLKTFYSPRLNFAAMFFITEFFSFVARVTLLSSPIKKSATVPGPTCEPVHMS